jgi:hypothetical protein
MPQVIQSKSKINYSYATIRITQSRLDKGLIAIPVSLAKWFPDHTETIQVYLNDSPLSQTKQYSSYNSSTRECRIGGLRRWFQQNNIKSGEEIVVQFTNKEHLIYRLIPESNFILKTKELQNSFDKSKSEDEATDKIMTLAQWAHLDKGKAMLNEYYRLTNTFPTDDRQYIKRTISRARESIPTNLRTVLEEIYKGHCQLCDFWFLKRNNKPYFEVHHLDPQKGHHPKNLVVVCGNCHNQYEQSNVKQEFNNEGWLVKVNFNKTKFSVTQIVSSLKKEDFIKELYI